MSPSYVFRIDYMEENPKSDPESDANGWRPSTRPGSNQVIGGAVSGVYWLCDGQYFHRIAHLPPGCNPFKTYSFYYDAGIWVSASDASRSDAEARPWRKLSFEWGAHDYSSFLSHAGEETTLRTQRPNQDWPAKLLPNIYHAPTTSWANAHTAYGGLKGELPILLALIAFSISQDHVEYALRTCFTGGGFQVHDQPNGWVERRGMVVRVYTCPSLPGVNKSTAGDLEDFEEGGDGFLFN